MPKLVRIRSGKARHTAGSKMSRVLSYSVSFSIKESERIATSSNISAEVNKNVPNIWSGACALLLAFSPFLALELVPYTSRCAVVRKKEHRCCTNDNEDKVFVFVTNVGVFKTVCEDAISCDRI